MEKMSRRSKLWQDNWHFQPDNVHWLAVILTSEITADVTNTQTYWKGKQTTDLLLWCKYPYETAIYLRTTYEGKAQVNLIPSKSRIWPKKIMLIPQLELLAVLIRVRSLDFVSKKLGITDSKPITRMDCQCVLNWIRNKKPLSVFVHNQITEINSTNDFEFWYINTKDNPTDVPSRGATSK